MRDCRLAFMSFRVRRILLALSTAALLWAVVIKVRGGAHFHIAGLTISSRDARHALLAALLFALVAWIPWRATDRRALAARVRRWSIAADAHPGPSAARAWTMVAIGLAMLGTLWLTRLPNTGGDTGWFLPATEAIADCLASDQWFRCGTSATGTDSYVRFYPLFQHLPDLVFVEGGLTPGERDIALSLVSIAAIAGALAAARYAFRRIGDEASWPAFLIVTLTSPLLYYGNSSWGEPLAAGLTVLFAAAAVGGARGRTLALAAFAATLTKETAFPFLGLLGTACLLLARERTGRPIIPRFVTMSAGIAGGLAVSAGFNLLRFGNPLNVFYLQPMYRVNAMADRMEFFAGQLVSPNAGLAFYWTSASLVIALAVCVPIALRLRGRTCAVLPALVLAALTGALTTMLSLWWAPYGGNAWGPRLSVPWVLGFVLYALAAYGRSAALTVAAVLRSNLRLVAIAVVLLVVTLPQIGFMLNHDAILTGFFIPNPSCPRDISITSPEGWRVYMTCMHYRVWDQHPVLLDAAGATASVPGVAFSAVWLLMLCALLQLIRLAIPRSVHGPAGGRPLAHEPFVMRQR
jgi:hypothetical protein